MKPIVIIIILSIFVILLSLIGLRSFFLNQPNQKDILKGYQKLSPIIHFLDKKLAENQPLPENVINLRIEYSAMTHKPFSKKIIYVRMDSIDMRIYKIYIYIRGVTTLWYLSASDGWQEKGWWIDYGDGSIPKRVFPEMGQGAGLGVSF